MARDILYKTPEERVVYTKDFVDDVPSGSSIAANGVTALAVDSSGKDATATILGTVTNSGTVVSVQLKATEVDGETYRIRIRAIMADSFSIANHTLEVRVRDRDTVE